MDVCISENPVKLSGEEFLKYLTTGWTGLADLPVQLLDENLQTTSWSGELGTKPTQIWTCVSPEIQFIDLFSLKKRTYLFKRLR